MRKQHSIVIFNCFILKKYIYSVDKILMYLKVTLKNGCVGILRDYVYIEDEIIHVIERCDKI